MSLKESYSGHAREFSPARATLVVKPDLLRVTLSVSLEAEELSQALVPLRRACEDVQKRARERLAPLSTDVTFRPHDARFGRATARNKLALSDEDASLVTLEGWLEVPLAGELDFWARAARLGALVGTCQEAQSDSRQSRKLPRFTFGTVEALVARPEEHREALLRHAAARAREVAALLGSDRAPLGVVECTPAGPVEQTSGSLEEVGLTLAVSCRLGVVDADAAQGRNAGG